MKNVLFLSELTHVSHAEKYIAEHPELSTEGYLLVPLDIIVERELDRKGTSYSSGRAYRTPDASPLTLSEEWVTALFNDTKWSFFSYRGVSLLRVYFFSLQTYLTPLLYYIDIVTNVFARHPSATRCIVFPPPNSAPEAGDDFIAQEKDVLVDAVRAVATQGGKEVVVPGGVPNLGARPGSTAFAYKRALFSICITVLNALVMLVRPPKHIKILVSDYWEHVAPMLSHLNGAEVLLLGRMEAFEAGFKNIFTYRMRFLHSDSFASRDSQQRKDARVLFEREWRSLQESGAVSSAQFKGISINPFFNTVLSACIRDTLTKTLGTIDDMHALLAFYKPDVVLLRITTSPNQPHFPVLAQVARAQGIPSLEIQHGLGYYGPGSLDLRHFAEYTGIYGARTAYEMQQVGDTYTTPVIIGSPRFDMYTPMLRAPEKKDAKSTVTVAVIAPLSHLGIMDTYDVEEYFQAVGSALKKVKNATAIIKLRPGSVRSLYNNTIASAFAGIPHDIVSDNSLVELYTKADIVVSGYSTAALEALLCEKPLIYFGLSPGERMMGLHHFSPYAERQAMRIATTLEQLETALAELAADSRKRAELESGAGAFMKEQYLFDGASGERAAALVESLAEGKRVC